MTALSGALGFIGAAVGKAPPYLWIPLALVCALLGFLVAHLARGVFKRTSESSRGNAIAPAAMGQPPTMLELFQADFPGPGKMFEETNIQFGPGGPKSTFHTNLYQDFHAGSKFLAFYVPRSPLAHQTYVALASQAVPIMERMEAGVQVSGGMLGENVMTAGCDLTFTGFVYLYCDDGPQVHELSDLTKLYEQNGLKLRVRAGDYRAMKMMSWYHERDC